MVVKELLLENEEVISKFLEGTKVIDNHNNEEIEVTGIISFRNDNKGIGAMINTNKFYSINKLYYDKKDNMLHLSEYSIGGVFCAYNTLEELEKLVDKYNESVLFNGGKIATIVDRDGNILCPQEMKESV